MNKKNTNKTKKTKTGPKKMIYNASGTRKNAVARATLTKGEGKVKINNILLDNYGSRMNRLKIMEPILLSGNIVKDINIKVKVFGGGVSSQADAIRLSIGKVLTEYKPELKEEFLNYDRHLLVADVRQKETHKPNRLGRARAAKPKGKR